MSSYGAAPGRPRPHKWGSNGVRLSSWNVKIEHLSVACGNERSLLCSTLGSIEGKAVSTSGVTRQREDGLTDDLVARPRNYLALARLALMRHASLLLIALAIAITLVAAYLFVLYRTL